MLVFCGLIELKSQENVFIDNQSKEWMSVEIAGYSLIGKKHVHPYF